MRCCGAITSLRPDAVDQLRGVDRGRRLRGRPRPRASPHNGLAVRWVAESCDRAGAHLVQLSTDYVFDGTLDRPYHEWDAPDPAQRLRRDASWPASARRWRSGTAAAIVRTSWVCGAARHQHGARPSCGWPTSSPTLAFVDDQIGHPTFTADLAPMLRRIAVDRRSGVHHVTNQRAVSWYEFAREVVAAMGEDPGDGRARSPPPTCSRRARRRGRPTACSTTRWPALSGLPPMRDFAAPLAELVAALVVAVGRD